MAGRACLADEYRTGHPRCGRHRGHLSTSHQATRLAALVLEPRAGEATCDIPDRVTGVALLVHAAAHRAARHSETCVGGEVTSANQRVVERGPGYCQSNASLASQEGAPGPPRAHKTGVVGCCLGIRFAVNHRGRIRGLSLSDCHPAARRPRGRRSRASVQTAQDPQACLRRHIRRCRTARFSQESSAR